jgi:hypothetical protein
MDWAVRVAPCASAMRMSARPLGAVPRTTRVPFFTMNR